jgi:hypothetical protein
MRNLFTADTQTETREENIRDLLQLDEGGPEFQLLTKKEIAAVNLLIYF